MAVSILHRVCGNALAFGGGILFVWWLVAAAASPAAYATFYYYVVHAKPGDGAGLFANIIAKLVGFGLTWSFFQHASSGMRHFVLDTGAGYDLKTNRMWSTVILFAPLLLAAAVWAYILLGAR